MVYMNIPLLLLGAPLVYQALAHYRATNGGKSLSERIGVQTAHWEASEQRHLPDTEETSPR